MTAARSASVVLFCTTPSVTAARRLARSLVARHLAACVSCLPGADSYFWWHGRTDHARETVLFIKTTRGRLASAMQFLKASHPYTVPELIAVPIVGGDTAYLTWLREACRG